MGNAAASNLVAALVDPLLLVKPVNYLRITFHPQGARRWILNWDEVARHLLARANRKLGGTTNDPAAVALLREIHGYTGTVALPYAPRRPVEDMLLPIHIRKDDVELRVFSTIMTLGTPQDVTLQELRIETFFPADEASERTWPRVARSGQE